MLTDTFRKISQEWEWPAANLMPDEIFNLSNSFPAYQSYGLRAAVEYLENSIGYLPFSGVYNCLEISHYFFNFFSFPSPFL